MSKYPMTLEETLQQVGEEFDKREAEHQKTVAARRESALNDAKWTWQREDSERLEEQKQGLITSMDELIECIHNGERRFRYYNTEYVNGVNVRFGKNFLNRVILPMLEKKSIFQFDGVIYGFEEEDVTDMVEHDTGERTYETTQTDGHDWVPVRAKSLETVAKDIRVGRVDFEQKRIIV
jgi:hypothetical protein